MRAWDADRRAMFRRCAADFLARSLAAAIHVDPRAEYVAALEMLRRVAAGDATPAEARAVLRGLPRRHGDSASGRLGDGIQRALRLVARKRLTTIGNSDTWALAVAAGDLSHGGDLSATRSVGARQDAFLREAFVPYDRAGYNVRRFRREA